MALKKVPDHHCAALFSRYTLAAVAAAALFITFPADVRAYPTNTDVIAAEFWTELDPAVDLEQGGVISQDEAIRRTLEEARIVVSGMIYGFEVRYVPSDRARQVEEKRNSKWNPGL